MATICDLMQCPYHSTDSVYCERGVTAIDENGMCAVVWKHGQQRKIINKREDIYPRREIVLDAFEVEEEAEIGTSDEDLTNGDAAKEVEDEQSGETQTDAENTGLPQND